MRSVWNRLPLHTRVLTWVVGVIGMIIVGGLAYERYTPHFYAPVVVDDGTSRLPAAPRVHPQPYNYFAFKDTHSQEEAEHYQRLTHLAAMVNRDYSGFRVVPDGARPDFTVTTMFFHVLVSPRHQVAILHTGWLAHPHQDPPAWLRWLPILHRDEWHEALWLLPSACADVYSYQPRVPQWQQPHDFNACTHSLPFLLAAMPDYTLPSKMARPEVYRAVNQVEFSPDERDLLFVFRDKHYRMRLPVWVQGR